MTQIVCDLPSCSQCPAHETNNQWSSDGWDRMEDWVCKDVMDTDTGKPKKVMGSVEWHDKVPIPDWCPRRLDNVIKKMIQDKNEEIH